MRVIFATLGGPNEEGTLLGQLQLAASSRFQAKAAIHFQRLCPIHLD